MAERIDFVTTRHSLKNTTDRYLLVGDYHQVIGSYANHANAMEAHDGIGLPGPDGLAETPYCRLDVLAPGESCGGDLRTPVVWDDGTDAAEELYRTIFRND